MSFESTFKIRSFHTDSFGHVNNARYLELLEEARWQFAEHHGLIDLLNEENLGFIIMQMNLRFRLPVVEGDTIQVFTSLITLGSDIGEVEQLIMKKGAGKLAAKSMFTFVLIGSDPRRHGIRIIPARASAAPCSSTASRTAGYRGLGGEIGHMVVELDGRPCPCGGLGHLEAYVARPAHRRGRHASSPPRTRAPDLAELAGGDPAAVTAENVIVAAREGDAGVRAHPSRRRRTSSGGRSSAS